MMFRGDILFIESPASNCKVQSICKLISSLSYLHLEHSIFLNNYCNYIISLYAVNARNILSPISVTCDRLITISPIPQEILYEHVEYYTVATCNLPPTLFLIALLWSMGLYTLCSTLLKKT